MKLSVLAAMGENRVIGRDGELPWRLPDEMKRLKALTMGHCLLMGRKTWDSIGRPLPGRTSIVITRNARFEAPGAIVVGDFDAALAEARDQGDDEPFVFGGAAIYALALPRADRLYLTRVESSTEGEVRFPEYDEAEWELVSREEHAADERHAFAFCFEEYKRRS
jgi:dihydrofolate reductase